MKRKAIKRGQRFDILSRDGFRCRYCGVTAQEAKLQVDHVIPVAAGGETENQNLAASCGECNGGKSAKLVLQAGATFLQWLRRQVKREDWIGDLADDEVITPLAEVNSYQDLSRQLRSRRASQDCLRAAWDAWREWRRGGKKTRAMAKFTLDAYKLIERNKTDNTCIWTKTGIWTGGQFHPYRHD
jgi:HNH endonuclease